MKVKDILEGRHPHDQYYRPKPKSQFKPKPRPKKTLWYADDQYNNWAADIRFRYPDAQAYYDEETEEVVAATPDMKKSYGKWQKKGKGRFKGFSFEKPRPLNTVTRFAKRLKKMEDPK
jgi:hypothetical protein